MTGAVATDLSPPPGPRRSRQPWRYVPAAFRALPLLLLAGAGPAGAQSLDLTDAVLTCLVGMQDPPGLAVALAEAGWTALPEDGYAFALAKGDLRLFAALDATSCTVASAADPTAAMHAALHAALELAGIAGAAEEETEMGCRALNLPDGRVATVNGGGPDPDCDSALDSAMTLYIPGG
jgi:hypothetical protein